MFRTSGVRPGLIQRPPRWLLEAFGIIIGKNPQQMLEDVQPVVDAFQRGFGQASYKSYQVVGSLGGPITTVIGSATDESFATRVKLAHLNSGTTSCNVQTRLQARQGDLVTDRLFTTPAGAYSDWSILGLGRQWIVVPPGCVLQITQNAYTITAGRIEVFECRTPAGGALDA